MNNSSITSQTEETRTVMDPGEMENTTVPASVELRAAKLSIYLLIFVFSVTGNSLVILSVLLFKRMKTVPNMFIANLAACDLVSTITSIPFDIPAEELGYWPYGGAMCKILWPLATFSTVSAVFTLLAISGDRYGALLYPLNIRYRITKKRFYAIITIVYLIAMLAVLPYMIFLEYVSGNGNGPQCVEKWPALLYRKVYTVFLFGIQYGVPLPIVIFIYVRLGMAVHKSMKEANLLSGKQDKETFIESKSKRGDSCSNGGSPDSRQLSIQRRREQNQKTFKMFLLIVLICLIFMLPNQVLWLWVDFGNQSESLLNNFDVVAFVCRAFTYTNSVLNAGIYGACNEKFRKAFVSIIKCQCGKTYQREQSRGRFTVDLARTIKGKDWLEKSTTTNDHALRNGATSAVSGNEGESRSRSVNHENSKISVSFSLASEHDNYRDRKSLILKPRDLMSAVKTDNNIEPGSNVDEFNEPVIFNQFHNSNAPVSLNETEELLCRICWETDFERSFFDTLQSSTGRNLGMSSKETVL